MDAAIEARLAAMRSPQELRKEIIEVCRPYGKVKLIYLRCHQRERKEIFTLVEFDAASENASLAAAALGCTALGKNAIDFSFHLAASFNCQINAGVSLADCHCLFDGEP